MRGNVPTTLLKSEVRKRKSDNVEKVDRGGGQRHVLRDEKRFLHRTSDRLVHLADDPLRIAPGNSALAFKLA
jgi:hypothetical protein